MIASVGLLVPLEERLLIEMLKSWPLDRSQRNQSVYRRSRYRSQLQMETDGMGRSRPETFRRQVRESKQNSDKSLKLSGRCREPEHVLFNSIPPPDPNPTPLLLVQIFVLLEQKLSRAIKIVTRQYAHHCAKKNPPCSDQHTPALKLLHSKTDHFTGHRTIFPPKMRTPIEGGCEYGAPASFVRGSVRSFCAVFSIHDPSTQSHGQQCSLLTSLHDNETPNARNS